jgi:hypothetical protein
MTWHRFDKSGKWLIQHHGDALIWLGGLRQVVHWEAVQSELVQPGQLPDGLLEVEVEGRRRPVPVILELATKAEKRLTRQLRRDLMLVLLDRDVVPEVITLILRREGKYQVPRTVKLRSRLGMSELTVTWRVVELWKESAEEMLAANNAGLIPFVPLARFDGPPEPLLRRCRERIEEQPDPDKRASLSGVSQIMARLVYNDQTLLDILGGSRAMLELPFIKEIEAKSKAEGVRDTIALLLRDRFGAVPEDLVALLGPIEAKPTLTELVRLARDCPDLETFRARLAAGSAATGSAGRRRNDRRRGRRQH